MAENSYKPMHSWLHHQSEHLNGLLDQVHLRRRLTNVLRSTLPEPLASRCLVANVDNDTLVVGCHSSAWAAKLRYQLPGLLDRFKSLPELPSLKYIRVRVQPLREEQPPPVYRRLKMSSHSAALISTIADNTVDPALKAALHRLSRRAGPDKID